MKVLVFAVLLSVSEIPLQTAESNEAPVTTSADMTDEAARLAYGNEEITIVSMPKVEAE